MKNAILVIGAASLAAILTLAMTAKAQDEDPAEFTQVPMPDVVEAYDDAPAPPQFRMAEKIKAELGLTETQTAQLETLRSENLKARIELGAKLKIAALELAELMKTQGNDDAVLQKAAEISALRSQMADLTIKHKLAVRNVFTAEQWKKVSELKRMGNFIRNRRGGHGFSKGRVGRGGSFRGGPGAFRGECNRPGPGPREE